MIYVLAGVKARIQERFATHLTDLGTEFSTTIKQPAYLDTEENVQSQLPSIEILPRDGDTDYGDDESPIIQGFEDHIIDIEMMLSGNNRTKTGMDLLLYREAIKRIVKEDETFGGRFHWVQLSSVQYSEMYQLKEQKTFVKVCRQTIKVRQVL